ncbi:MAG: DNA polymerase I [Planctomycetes bacterium]|nr:DNA polymerase I [Planctomycetota bacterium]
MPETLYLIDVFSLVFQVFHAIPEMTSPRGMPTNAVYGFTRDILNILQQRRPTHLICATDPSGPGERERIYPQYKANRSETPEELRPQFPLVAQTIEAFGIPRLEVPGWEADDVIATVVTQAAARDMDVFVVTNDKDARQLLGPRVKIYQVRKDLLLGESELLADWGVRPDQVIDFQSLVGDSVDNVPGVPLIGPKKASALLAQFHTLEGVLAHADEAPGAKLRENLKTYADQARLSRQLVELRRDLPLVVDWDAARIGQWDVTRLQELFREFGFRRFADDVRTLSTTGGPVAQTASAAPAPRPPAARSSKGAGTRNLFSDDAVDALAPPVSAEPSAGAESLANSGSPDESGSTDASGAAAAAPPLAAEKRPLTFEIVDTPEKLAALAQELATRRKFCLDLETTSLDPLRADIVGWAISWAAHAGYYIPVRAPAGQPQLPPDSVVAVLKPILESDDVEISNQNIKYDMLVLRHAGIRLRGIGFDPMIGSYLLEAGARSHNLDDLAQRYLGHQMIPIVDLIGKGLFQKRMDEIDVPVVAEYAVEDAEVAWDLANRLGTQLREQGLWDLYWNLERPLIEVLAELQANGIRVDAEQLRVQSAAVGQRLDQVKVEIYQLAGREFNIDSTKQLQQVLFAELKLPIIKKTKTGASTDQEVLEQLAVQHPLPSLLLMHRTLTKLKGTYLDALPEMINPETGKIHTSFNQVVAATGRLSSSEPNLQNIPIRTEEGQRVRRAFVPSPEGWQLLCADYSQIELRMLAHFSGDPAMCEAFATGADVHTVVAAQIFDVPADKVDSQMRRVAKAVNFGVIYGQSPFGLSAALGISQGDAAKFIDEYFSRYAGIDVYLRQLLVECASAGYATTILGRRRAIDGIRTSAPSNRQRNMPERTAINTVIQGSAADLIKQAMLRVYRRLRDEQHPGRMLLQIHDELVFEAPADRIADLAVLVRTEMEQALPLSVPLQVDVSAGPNWLDTEPLAEM